MSNQTFIELSLSHAKLINGVFVSEIYQKGGVEFYKGFNPLDIYNSNYGILIENDPSKLDSELISNELKKLHPNAGIYLTDENVEQGYLEAFIRKGYKFEHGDTWMLYDTKANLSYNTDVKIQEVTEKNFQDYYQVLSDVFTGYDGNEGYLDILKNILNVNQSEIKDLNSKLFLIYENHIPVAGAGLFISSGENLAYLHDGGTLPSYRGKGYQSALIQHRVNVAKENNISRIYSAVEQGGQSWSNLIKLGFKQLAQTNVLRVN